MDHALVRFFITQLLESTAPPDSALFVKGRFEIAQLPGAELALKNDPNSVKCMTEFANHIHENMPDFASHETIARWKHT